MLPFEIRAKMGGFQLQVFHDKILQHEIGAPWFQLALETWTIWCPKKSLTI
jgi:hypothetical protein